MSIVCCTDEMQLKATMSSLLENCIEEKSVTLGGGASEYTSHGIGVQGSASFVGLGWKRKDLVSGLIGHI